MFHIQGVTGAKVHLSMAARNAARAAIALLRDLTDCTKEQLSERPSQEHAHTRIIRRAVDWRLFLGARRGAVATAMDTLIALRPSLACCTQDSKSNVAKWFASTRLSLGLLHDNVPRRLRLGPRKPPNSLEACFFGRCPRGPYMPEEVLDHSTHSSVIEPMAQPTSTSGPVLVARVAPGALVGDLDFWRPLVRVSPAVPKFAYIRITSANLVRNRPKLPRLRPILRRNRPLSATNAPEPTNVGPNAAKLDECWAGFDQVGHNFGQLRPKCLDSPKWPELEQMQPKLVRRQPIATTIGVQFVDGASPDPSLTPSHLGVWHASPT